MISAREAPWERRIRSRTSAFLLPSRACSAVFFATGRAVVVRLAFGGDFFAFPFAGATGFAGCATSANRRSTAFQIRATAAFLFVNFLTGFKSVKGATPAKLFQVSTKREIGQSAVSFARSFWLVNDCDSSAPAGSPACAVMLLLESIVKV